MKDKKKTYRNYLIENKLKSQQTFDKVLLTISSGALGLSITFNKYIFSENLITGIKLLYLSWIAWGISLCLLLIGHYFSSKAWQKAIEDYDDKNWNNQKVGEPYCTLVERINFFGLLSFIIGMFIYIVFTIININNVGI